MKTISENKKPIVINLFGPPGSGKSTGAAEVFAALKKLGVNAELVTEFAKDKAWEHNLKAVNNQAYVFGKQCYRMSRCADEVDVIITDSPLFLSIIYNKDPRLTENFNKTDLLFQVGTILLPFIFLPILAFSDKKYSLSC
jgi:Ni2+-binding GTPase involved in maturation of urease and hydrogenase